MRARSRARLLRVSYFVWLVVPALMFGIYHLYGLPHLLLTYSWRENGLGYGGPISERHFTRCSYIGPGGWQTIFPADGSCDFIRFFKTSGTNAGSQTSHGLMNRYVCDGKARRQLLLRDDLKPDHRLQHIEYGLFVNDALGNLLIAILSGLHGDVERRDFLPELIKSKRVQPLVNIISVFEIAHLKSVPKRVRKLQIWSGNRGSA